MENGKPVFVENGKNIGYHNFYNPNISFTIRSAPLTSPVRMSILKMSCPMYCHAIVTAGKVASAAGVLLERNAE